MPLYPIDYNNAIIYKIVCNDLNIKELYIGSTTNFIKRKQQHKCNCNNSNSEKKNLPIYKFIRENGNWENWSMIMIEEFSCENKLELLKRERYWIENLKTNLNGHIPSRTLKEYRIDNKSIINQKQNEYRNDNKEIINKKQIDNYYKNKEIYNQKRKIKTVCICGIEHRIADKARHTKSKKHIDFINSQSKE